MNNPNLGNILALKEYNRVNLQAGIESASPHRLIQMLIDGALSRLAQAKGHMKANSISQKGEDISMAISIIGGLRDSLDHDKGGTIAGNLDGLYDYMSNRLMESNLKNDVSILDEVHDLLTEIKLAWDAIASHQEVMTEVMTEVKQLGPAA
jgi:flagellar secretion chaperone FliS